MVTGVVAPRDQVATAEGDVVRVYLIDDGRRPVVAVASDTVHAEGVMKTGSGKEDRIAIWTNMVVAFTFIVPRACRMIEQFLPVFLGRKVLPEVFDSFVEG